MPTLLGRLMARPDADLAALAHVWGARLPGRGHAEDVAALYRVMTDSWALRDVLEGLAPDSARLLWSLARSGEPGTATVDEAQRPAAEELIARGLLHPASEEDAGASRTVALADETGARLRRLAEERRVGDRSGLPLAALLASLDGGELAAACERWGLEVTPGSQPRAEIEAALLEAVATPLALEDLLARLDRTDRVLYDLLAATGRPLPLAEAWQRSGLPPAALRRALRHLHEALLVWESWVERERRLFVPPELRSRGEPDRPQWSSVAADPTGWRHPLALAWDVLAWLRRGQGPTSGRRAPDPLPPGYPLWGAPSQRQRSGYLEFLRAATRELDQSAIDGWAAQSLADQQAALFARWRERDQPWSALRLALVGGLTPGLWRMNRDAILKLLERMESGRWYTVDTLAVHHLADGREHERGARRPLPYHRRSGIDVRSIAYLVQAELVWLGVLELGRVQERREPAVRLTAVGRWLLDRGAPPPTPPVAALVAEPSLRLLVYEADAALLWPLLAFAEPEQVDRVSLFRLTRAGVAAGLAANLTAEAMIATLARAARHELPQNVAYSIRDWARGARRARLERALILAFDGDQARDEALAQLALRGLAAELLPRHRLALPVADDAAEERVRAALRQLGLDGDGGMP